MVSGIMILGVVGFCVGASIIGLLSYMKGFNSGSLAEGDGWMEAFTRIKPPNWQSFPIDPTKGHEDILKQIEAAKIYAEVFKTAYAAIGQELLINRVKVAVEGLENDAR